MLAGSSCPCAQLRNNWSSSVTLPPYVPWSVIGSIGFNLVAAWILLSVHFSNDLNLTWFQSCYQQLKLHFCVTRYWCMHWVGWDIWRNILRASLWQYEQFCDRGRSLWMLVKACSVGTRQETNTFKSGCTATSKKKTDRGRCLYLVDGCFCRRDGNDRKCSKCLYVLGSDKSFAFNTFNFQQIIEYLFSF